MNVKLLREIRNVPIAILPFNSFKTKPLSGIIMSNCKASGSFFSSNFCPNVSFNQFLSFLTIINTFWHNHIPFIKQNKN